jgi:mRNA interferase MazF
MNIGEIYFMSLNPEDSNEIIHPYVVCKKCENEENGLTEYFVCMISTNMKKAYWPGNIILNTNEGGLQKRSIVIVSKTERVIETQKRKYIGKMSDERVIEIIEAINALDKRVINRKNEE